jgi:hypothetical protein
MSQFLLCKMVLQQNNNRPNCTNITIHFCTPSHGVSANKLTTSFKTKGIH